jgi:hypothetical protein
VGPTGLGMLKLSHFYSYLLPPAVGLRLVKTITGKNKSAKSDFIKVTDWINRLLLGLSGLETGVVAKMDIPAGLSLVCVLKKPVNIFPKNH